MDSGTLQFLLNFPEDGKTGGTARPSIASHRPGTEDRVDSDETAPAGLMSSPDLPPGTEAVPAGGVVLEYLN